MIIEELFFLFLIKTICCDPSSELSHQDNPHEGSQHLFLCRTNEILLLIIKYSFLSTALGILLREAPLSSQWHQYL